MKARLLASKLSFQSDGKSSIRHSGEPHILPARKSSGRLTCQNVTIPSCLPCGRTASRSESLQTDQKACTRCGMIIVIANSKGGVGKSTIAVHLAAWLHEQGHSVILADCD